MRKLEAIGTLMVIGGMIAAMAGNNMGGPVFGIGLLVFIVGRFQR
jgi:hypothetical protein